MLLKKKTFEMHPAGLFTFKIDRIEEDTLEFGDVFKIGLKSPMGETTVVCSQSYSDRSKFGGIVQAVLGKMPEDLETNQLIGREVQGLVEYVTKGDKVYDRVEKFLPVGKQHDPFSDA